MGRIRGRLCLMGKASWPTLLGLTAAVIIFTLLGANWPEVWDTTPSVPPDPVLERMRGDDYNATSIQNLVTFGLAIAFLSIKNTLMLQRMGKRIDWLTVTLVMANYAFAALYLLVISGALFPYWFATHPHETVWLTNIIRGGLVITLLWSIWTLTGIPEPPPASNGRKLGYTAVSKETT